MDGKCSLHSTRPRKQAHWLRSSLQSKGNPAHVLWATDCLRSNLTPDSGPADVCRNGGHRREHAPFDQEQTTTSRQCGASEKRASKSDQPPSALPAFHSCFGAPAPSTTLGSCRAVQADPTRGRPKPRRNTRVCRPGTAMFKLTLKTHQTHRNNCEGLTTH